MKLSDLFPFENCLINGYSLIHNVFGPSFVVYDAFGVMHTTAWNLKLLRQAQVVLEDIETYDAEALSSTLEWLRKTADCLRQADYEFAVRQQRPYANLQC